MSTEEIKETITRCDCATKVDAMLERDHGLRLKRDRVMNMKTGEVRVIQPMLAVEKIDGSKDKVRSFVCSYCPFCGKKYAD